MVRSHLVKGVKSESISVRKKNIRMTQLSSEFLKLELMMRHLSKNHGIYSQGLASSFQQQRADMPSIH